MIIRNTQNRPHAFTQKDGNTFRLTAFETKPIEDSLISKEMIECENLGWISFIKEQEMESYSKVSKLKSVKKNKLEV